MTYDVGARPRPDQRRLLDLLELDFLPLLDPRILEDKGDHGYHVFKVLGMSLGVEAGQRLITHFGHSQRLDMHGQKMSICF